ncbi:MAG: sn-glycerol-3-phosphate ABC transporter ATP-binding protein UgpC [Arenicellales bacterium]|nr:sn-glycerol-3-phosphate ABC transporter ATP-binding protein UgpC [Arenicellales bacterium]
MAELTLTGVHKAFPNGVTAVAELDITIVDGEFLVLVGPSGCGKSTLLRLVAGLEQLSGGDICLDGENINNVEPAARNIAMVFQNYALYPHMTVYGNMAYGLRNRGLKREEIVQLVHEGARTLEIEELLDRKPKQLSGGQRQRVAMGRAIVRNPTLFLFDEPLSNLDAKLRVQMRLEIKRLQTRMGTTSIYVTHDQVEAMTMADRLVVMNGGIAEQIGSPAQVYRQPATMFVAGFIGSPAMNFFPVESRDGKLTLEDGTPLVHHTDGAARAESGLTLGIRPEHIRFDPVGHLQMTVEIIELLGAETIVHGQIGSPGWPVVVRHAGDPGLEPGTTANVMLVEQDIHLFDSTSGIRCKAG